MVLENEHIENMDISSVDMCLGDTLFIFILWDILQCLDPLWFVL